MRSAPEMPRLLSINNYFYPRGGSEAVYFGHNRLLEELGWSVVPFAMKHPANLPTPWAEYFIDELELDGRYSIGQKLARLPKVIYSLESRRRIDRLLAHARPDLAHAHNIYHHISPSILGLLRRREIPVVVTLHDLKISCPAYTMLTHDGVCERCRGGRVYNVVLNRCIGGSAGKSLIVLMEALVHDLLGSYRRHVDRFIVPSRFYLEKFCEWGWPRTQFRYVPNFVDAGRYQPDSRPGRYFVYFGRLTRQKGVASLIRAVAAAGVPLWVAGTGPELEELKQLAAGLRAEVSFPGHLSGETLHEAVRGSRAVVLPSEWYENAPISLLEAYALGKPVLGARIGGIPELIREGETGLCFGSGDVDALTHALKELASRPDSELERMGQCGRAWVEQEFTKGQYLRRILAAYDELGLANGSASRAFQGCSI